MSIAQSFIHENELHKTQLKQDLRNTNAAKITHHMVYMNPTYAVVTKKAILKFTTVVGLPWIVLDLFDAEYCSDPV